MGYRGFGFRGDIRFNEFARCCPYYDYDKADMDKLAEQIDGNKHMFEARKAAMNTRLNVQTNIHDVVTLPNVSPSVNPYHYEIPMDEEASRTSNIGNNGTTSTSHNSTVTRRLFDNK